MTILMNDVDTFDVVLMDRFNFRWKFGKFQMVHVENWEGNSGCAPKIRR